MSHLHDKNVVRAFDMFCGAGGSSTGMAMACDDAGIMLKLGAINHWDIAVATHAKNHPDALHKCANVDEMPLAELAPDGTDILWASPSCFSGDTLIVTDRGLLPISDVIKGDRVLTHRGRWRNVSNVLSTRKPTVKIVGQGCSQGIVTTAEHPFLSRSRSRFWDNGQRNWAIRLNNDEQWTPAHDMKGRFWATPTKVGSLGLPPAFACRDTQFWWMIGRWLGDGDVRLTQPLSSIHGARRGNVRIVCGKHEADTLQNALTASGYRWSRKEERTVTKFSTSSALLPRFLIEHFGHTPIGKTIPSWAFGMPRQLRLALLDGYISANGHITKRSSTCSTISRRLALGIRLLAESLGFRATMHFYAPPRKPHQIEGRPITSRPHYEVQWVLESKASRTSTTTRHSWSAVKAVEATGQTAVVYNLSVEEDESYVADGIVVHNCTEHSYAKGGHSIDDQKRASAWAIPRAVEAWRPKVIIIENVRNMLKWGPTEPVINTRTGKPKLDKDGKPVMRPIKARKGETFRAWFSAIESLGYSGKWDLLNAADYGGAQTRLRLFIVFTTTDYHFTFPAPTHGKPGTLEVQRGIRQPWVGARQIIDWTLPSQDIFDRERPLSPNTIRRIEEGIRRYCTELAEPFLVVLRHYQNAQHLDEPSPTVAANGLHIGLAEPTVEPFALGQHGGSVPRLIDDPLSTITGAGYVRIFEPFITSYAERDGAGSGKKPAPPHSVDDPLSTVLTRDRFGVAEPFMIDVRHGDKPHQPKSVDDPVDTVTSKNGAGVVEPFLLPQQAECSNRSIDEPVPTIAATRPHHAIVEPFIIPQQNASKPLSTDDPVPTLTTTTRGMRLIEPFLVANFGERHGQVPRTHDIDEPTPTVTHRGAGDLVEPTLNASDASSVDPRRLVMINGTAYRIGIRFRMLSPHELARAQGFPDDYEFTGTKTAQTMQIGNAVHIDVAYHLMRQALTAIFGDNLFAKAA